MLFTRSFGALRARSKMFPSAPRVIDLGDAERGSGDEAVTRTQAHREGRHLRRVRFHAPRRRHDADTSHAA